MANVTQIISQLGCGDPQTAELLLPLVYSELRKLAAVRLADERLGYSLQATGLVHEAFLRLTSFANGQQWNSRGHFFAAAAQAMRRILVERARSRNCEVHGGDWRRVNFDQLDPTTSVTPDQLLALDEALSRLALIDPIAGKMVEIRYFSGQSVSEIATDLGISPATAYRHWEYARAWLHGELLGDS